jgi:Secretion system C-terminal sorting domain
MKKKILSCFMLASIAANTAMAVPTYEKPRAHFWSKSIDVNTLTGLPSPLIGNDKIEVNALSALTISSLTRIYVAGTFTGSITLPGGFSLTSSGGKDVFVGSYNPDNGIFYGATKFGGVNDDEATGIALRSYGTHANVRVVVSANYNTNIASNIVYANTNGLFATPGIENVGPGFSAGITTNGTYFYIAGSFKGNLSFANGTASPITLSLKPGVSKEFFVAKIQTAAILTSNVTVARSVIKPFNTTTESTIGDITYSPNGRLYVTGTFNGNIQFNSNPLSIATTSSSLNEIFVASINAGESSTTALISFNLNDQQKTTTAEADFYEFGPQYQRIIANLNGVFISGFAAPTASFGSLNASATGFLSLPLLSAYNQYSFLAKYNYASAGVLGSASQLAFIQSEYAGDDVKIKGLTTDGSNVYATGTSGIARLGRVLTGTISSIRTNTGGLLAKFDNSLNILWAGQITRAPEVGEPIFSAGCGNALAYTNCKLYLGGSLYDATVALNATSEAPVYNFAQQNSLPRNSKTTGLLTSLSANVNSNVNTVCLNTGSIYTSAIDVSNDITTGVTYSWATTVVPVGGTVTYSSTTVKNPTVTFNKDGDYTLNLTVTGLGCPTVIPFVIKVRKTASQLLQTNPIPTTYSGGGSCPPFFSPSLLIGAPAISGLVYSWTGPAGISNPNIAQPTVTQTGTYTVVVKTAERFACNSPVTVVVTASHVGPDCLIGNTNNTKGVQANIGNEVYNITTYPNPTANILNIDINNLEFKVAVITIFDVTGKKQLNKTLSNESNSNQMDVSELSNGIYFYDIIIDNQRVARNKFIISK